jgi:SAM-dependent methyltransferase
LGWPARRLLDRRIDWILAGFNYRQDRLETELRFVTEALGESLLDRRLARLESAGELAVPIDTARFLNWAEGPEGPAARAGLWFNPPVPVRYEENAVDVLLVNERIVEQPYVFGALAGLPAGARVLDVGGSESTIALSLASLGHHVHVVDPRGYRLKHPSLRQSEVMLDELSVDLRFDAAIAVSSIEHFGLGAYGEPADHDARADLVALSAIRDHLAPGGPLVLTVPCAASPSRDEFQRTYSLAQVREMLAGWELVDLSVAWQQDRQTWIRDRPDVPQDEPGVALITARKPG